MKGWNAFGFLMLGVLAWGVPAWQPGWFPPGPIDGASTSALWLQTMGGLNALLGAGGLVWFNLSALLVRLATGGAEAGGDPGAVLFRAPFRRVTAWPDYEALRAATTVDELEPEPLHG